MHTNMIRQHVNEVNIKLRPYKIEFYETDYDSDSITFEAECTNHLISDESSIGYNEELKYIFEENLGYKCTWSRHYATVVVNF